MPKGSEGSGDRYTAVDRYFELDIALKIFKVEIEIGLGFDWTIPSAPGAPDVLNAVLKVAGNTSIDLNANYKAYSSEKEDHNVDLVPEESFKLYLEFAVDVFGKGLRSEGGVRGGWDCEAGLAVSFSQCPQFKEVKFGTKPLEFYGQFTLDLIIFDRTGSFTVPVMPACTIYKSDLPETAAA
jgi:hypothetical protein